MRIVISFLLSLFVYALVIIFLYFAFFQTKKIEEKKEIFVHTAILVKPNVKKYVSKPKIVKQPKKELKSVKKIKEGSKSSLTKSGSVDFNDIFKNVNYNLKTEEVKLKKQEEMSRLKGIKRNLKALKDINLSLNNTKIFYKLSSKSNKEKVDKFIKEVYEIWSEISFIPGEYATIHIIANDKKINAIILDSNMGNNKQVELVKKIESLNFDGTLDLVVKLQTKVKK